MRTTLGLNETHCFKEKDRILGMDLGDPQHMHTYLQAVYIHIRKKGYFKKY